MTWMALPYVDVKAQYREDKPTNSQHMYVLEDGTFRIDHIDEGNPHDDPITHAQKDMSVGQVLLVVGGLLAACRFHRCCCCSLRRACHFKESHAAPTKPEGAMTMMWHAEALVACGASVRPVGSSMTVLGRKSCHVT